MVIISHLLAHKRDQLGLPSEIPRLPNEHMLHFAAPNIPRVSRRSNLRFQHILQVGEVGLPLALQHFHQHRLG